MAYEIEKECTLAYSSPDGAMCDGFLHTHSCPAVYFLEYTPKTCPVNPPYPKGTTAKDYAKAKAALKETL